jgi:hypothetical protein
VPLPADPYQEAEAVVLRLLPETADVQSRALRLPIGILFRASFIHDFDDIEWTPHLLFLSVGHLTRLVFSAFSMSRDGLECEYLASPALKGPVNRLSSEVRFDVRNKDNGFRQNAWIQALENPGIVEIVEIYRLHLDALHIVHREERDIELNTLK